LTDLAEILGTTAAEVMRLHLMVIDREDRLESGTGSWLADLVEDDVGRESAARDSILRVLGMISDPTNFQILQTLTNGVGTPIDDLVTATGVGRLALAERIGDLVSAGLAAKIPEANQVAGVPAGAALVNLVTSAAGRAALILTRDL